MIKLSSLGARFDFDKVKWYNQQYIIAKNNEELVDLIMPEVVAKGYNSDREFLNGFVSMMKERVERTTEFISSGYYFFERPTSYNEKMIRKKFKSENIPAFRDICKIIAENPTGLQDKIKSYITDNGYGFGQILPILRIAITGSMQGPDLFEMMELLGQSESEERIKLFLDNYSKEL